MSAAPRAAIYARISKHDPRVAKVENQEASCRELAIEAGYEVVRVFVDDGFSASTGLDRPGYKALLRAAENHEFDVLLALAEDRFSRQPAEKIALTMVCAASGITWHTKLDGRVDPQTEEGELFAYLRGWQGRNQVRANGKKAREANERARMKGLPHRSGVRPFGWEDDRVTVREEEAELIRWATDHLLKGGGLWTVVEAFRASGIPTTYSPARARKHPVPERLEEQRERRAYRGEWALPSIRSVLTRARNAGLFEHRPQMENGKQGKREVVVDAAGQPVRGQWQAIVSIEDWEALRRVLSARNPGQRIGQPNTLLGGIATCACGEKLVSNYSSSRGKTYPTYRCRAVVQHVVEAGNGQHSSIRTTLLDPLARAAVIDSYMTKPFEGSAKADEARALQTIYAKRDKINAEIRNLRESVAAGVFTAGEVAADVAARRSALAEIEDELARAAASSANTAMLHRSTATLWSAVADLPVTMPSSDGVSRFNPLAAVAASAARSGRSESDALNRTFQAYWDGNPEADEMRLRLGELFDELPLEQQRNLVRALVRVNVGVGRGTDRVRVSPAKPAAGAELP